MKKKKPVIVSDADIDLIESMTITNSTHAVEYRDIVLRIIAEVRHNRDKQDSHVFDHVRECGLW